jgi:tripartite-type tricarboxylate transporter receptor subunit TctC
MNIKAYIVSTALSVVSAMVFPLTSTYAQKDYPTRSVEIVAPAPAGGGQDLIMRALANVAEKYMGQPLIPVNRSGGGGAVGTAFVAKAKPDGYTILINTPSNMVSQPLAQKLPYGSDDFIPIGRLTVTPEIILVPASSPWKNIKMFAEDARKNPGKFRFSSGGPYSPEHILFSVLSQKIGTKLIHIPTDGGAPALAMLLGSHVEVSCFYLPVAKSHLASGAVRALAVNSTERLPFEGYEGIPTLKEELDFTPPITWWFGIFAPKGTPQPIVQKLRSLVKQASDDKEFIKIMVDLGLGVQYMNGDEFGKLIKEQKVRFAESLNLMK